MVLYFTLSVGGRIGEVKRVTKETNVAVKINLDGSGVADSSTGIPFLDHMLDVNCFSSPIQFFIVYLCCFFQQYILFMRREFSYFQYC